MLSDGKITEIFCMADDFCKFFNETVKRHTLEENVIRCFRLSFVQSSKFKVQGFNSEATLWFNKNISTTMRHINKFRIFARK